MHGCEVISARDYIDVSVQPEMTATEKVTAKRGGMIKLKNLIKAEV